MPAALPGADPNAETPALALVFATATAWLVDVGDDLRQFAFAGLEPAIAGLTADRATHDALAADLRGRLTAMAAGCAAALDVLGVVRVPALTGPTYPLPGTAEQVQAWLAGVSRVRPACAVGTMTCSSVKGGDADTHDGSRRFRAVGRSGITAWMMQAASNRIAEMQQR